MPVDLSGWITVITPLSVVIGGLFALFKWIDQRKRETQDKRFEQYWKLVDISQETQFVAKQKVALLLLKRFPEYSDETVEFLPATKEIGGSWSTQNAKEIDSVLKHFAGKTKII